MQFICFSLNIIAQTDRLVKDNPGFFFQAFSLAFDGARGGSIPARRRHHKGPHENRAGLCFEGRKERI